MPNTHAELDDPGEVFVLWVDQYSFGPLVQETLCWMSPLRFARKTRAGEPIG